METIKIGFTGNRNGLSFEQKEQIKLILDNYTNIIVSHGDCVGADADFHDLCINYRETYPDKSLMIHIFPPSDPKQRAFKKGDVLMGEKPYLVRNSDIIKHSSILIGCPIDKNTETLRSGTWSTIRKARKQNLLLYIL